MAVTNPTGTGTEAGTRSEATAAEACSRGSSAKQEWEENIGRGDASSLPSNGRVGVCWFRRERKLAAMVSMTGKVCGHDGVSPGLGFCSSSELDGRTDMGMAFGGFLQEGKLSNCSGSSWRSGAQAPYRSRLGWSAGALDHVLSPHRELPFVYNWGVLRTPLFYQIKSLCNCTSAAPEPLVPQSKRSTQIEMQDT